MPRVSGIRPVGRDVPAVYPPWQVLQFLRAEHAHVPPVVAMQQHGLGPPPSKPLFLWQLCL